MLKFLQNKWLVAILLILGIAVAGAFLLMVPQTSVDRKGITLDRDKLPQRQKQPGSATEEKEREAKTVETAPQRDLVGSVTQFKGLAFAEFEKEKRVLEEGAPIFQGDRIVTGGKARLILKMKDDAVIALGEDSEFLVQQYTFKVRSDNTISDDDGNKGQVELTKGVAKFTSGRLGQLKKKPFHLVTPVATMGVRGTQGYIKLNGLGDDQGIEVVTLKDEVLVWMEESKKDLSSSSGEIHFLTALISEAFAADLSKDPTSVKQNQMLAGSRKTPPVVSAAPPEKLNEAHTSTVVKKLPGKALQALSDKVAQSLVEKGAAANVEEAAKLLLEAPEVLDKMVEAAEESLMEETKAQVAEELEKQKELGSIEEEIKVAQASGDEETLAELNKKKQALQSEVFGVGPVIEGIVDEKSADKALEKTASKVEAFSEEVTKAVAEGKSLKEVIENKAREVKEEKKEKAKALGVEDLDRAKKAGESAREVAREAESKLMQEGGGKKTGTDVVPTGDGVTKSDTKGDTKPGTEGTVDQKTDGEAGKKGTEGAVDAKTDPDSGKGGDTRTPPVADTKAGAEGRDPNSVFAEAAKGSVAVDGSTSSTTSSSGNSNTTDKSAAKATPIVFNKPSVMAAQTFTIDENKPAKTVVGTLVATDPDKGNILVYTLTPGDTFTVDAATGTISTVGSLDFEKANSYALKATVTDNVPDNTKDKKVTIVTADITITVNNINEAPTLTVPAALSVDEDTPLLISGITVSDPDSVTQVAGVEGGELTVKLEAGKGVLSLAEGSGTKVLTVKSKLATLNSDLAKLRYKPDLDVNGSDTIKVDVDDPGVQGSGTPLTASGSVAITIKPINDPPVLTTSEFKFTLDENGPVGTVVGAVVATDPEKDPLTYAIAKGNQGNVFAIDAKTGQITVNKDAKIDFETASAYTLEISVTDAGTPPQTLVKGNVVVNIQINNVNEAPTLVMPGALSVDEDNDLPISGITLGDPDITATATTAEMTVKLAAAQGVLRLAEASGVTLPAGASGTKTMTLKGRLSALNSALATLRYAPEPQFNGSDAIKVDVDDLGNLGSGGSVTASGTIVMTVKPVNDLPVFAVVDNRFTVDENKATGTIVGSVSATDIEKDVITYDITKGNLGNAFTIDSGTGQITVNKDAKLDFEKDPVYNLEVAAKDGGSQVGAIPAKVLIQISNVNEPPVLSLPQAISALEDTIKPITDIGISDPDLSDTSTGVIKLTLSVERGTLSTRADHSLSEKALVLTDTLANVRKELGKLNYRGGASYFGADILTLRLDDQGNTGSGTANIVTGTVAITVLAVNDIPTMTSIADVTIDEDKSAGPLSFQVGDIDNLPSDLTVTAASSNTDLVPVANVVFSGKDADRTLTVTPVANRFGTAVITLTVADTSTPPGSTTASFTLTVKPVADKPAVTAASTTEDVQTVSGLVISRSSVDGDEVTHWRIANIVNGLLYKKDGTTAINEGDFITAAEGTASLRFTPSTDLNSEASTFGFDVYGATATALTSTGSEKATAVITVTSVNDAPVITLPSNPVVNEDTNLEIVGLRITDVDAGSSAVQVTLMVNKGILTLSEAVGVTIDSGASGSGLIVMSGTVTMINNALAKLIYKGNANAYGNDSLSVKVSDKGYTGADGAVLTDEETLTISVVAVNDAAVITPATTAKTFTEGNAVGNNTPVNVDTGLSISDVDSSNLQGATITISNGYDAGKDVLDFSNTASITKSWDAGTGVLTLTGSAGVSDYQAALREVTYTSTSDDPAAGTRTITIKVNDGTDDSLAATYSVTVVPVNDPPTLTAGGSLSYTENDVATSFDTTFTLADLDNATMAGATVVISSGYQNDADGADILAFTNTSSITGSWNAVSGQLTLTGSASKTAYVAALKSITYFHNGDNPLTPARTISTTINDGTDSSTTVTSTVTMTAVNDPPAITATASVTYNEGIDATLNQATVVDAGVTVTDAERNTVTGASIAISTNYVNGEDVLIFPASMGDIVADTGNGSDGGIAGWNASTGVLKLTGSATAAQYQAALATVQYNNLDSDSPTASARTISFYATDTAQGSAATVQVTVVPKNDSPTLTGGGSPLTTYTEDSPTSKHADLIDNGIVVADVDNTNISSATVTITSATLDQGKDVLAFSSSYSSSNITGSFSSNTGVFTLSGSDTVANYQAALRAVTYANSSDNPTSGSRAIEFVVNDGALSSSKVTRTITVVDVNDAPTVVSGGTMTYTENATPTVVHSGVTVADFDSTNMSGATVRVTGSDGSTLYPEDRLAFSNGPAITGSWDDTNKILTLSGTATVAEYQAALATVTYANYYAGTNNLNDNPTAGTRTVSFTVSDSAPLASNTATATVTVVAVNDPPTLTAPTASITYTEDSPSPMVAISTDPNSQFTISDAETNNIQGATIVVSGVPTTTGNGPADELQFSTQNGITGTWNGSTRTLTLTGTTTLANYQTALRSVTYINDSQDPGDGARTLTWTVTDAGGGSATATSVTSTLTVVAVNDAPTVTNAASSITYIEDEEPDNTANENHKKVVSSTVTVADVDNGNLTGATVSVTTATYQNGQDVLAATVQGNVTAAWDATNGILTLSGTDTKATYEAVLRTVTYQNTSDNPITTTRNIQYVVSDGQASNSTSAIVTGNMQSSVAITATNDAPVLGGSSVLTFTEQASAVTIADQALLSKQPAVFLGSGVTISDAESNNIQGATVQITGNYSSSEDLLAFSNTASITGSWNSTSGTMTLTGSDTVGNYQTALRSITYQNTNVASPSSLTRTVIWIVSDGQAENSTSNSLSSSVIVVPVNDSPLLAGGGRFWLTPRTIQAKIMRPLSILP